MSPPRHLNYGRHLVDEDDVASVVSVLRGDLLTQGPVVERFEAALAEYASAKHAVAVSNGTAALHIACLAAGLEPGDFGLTSSLTFIASANCLLYTGADCGLVDIDPIDLGMSIEGLRAAIQHRPDTKAVVSVDFGGLAGNAEKIRATAGDRIVIEDAAHALGSSYACGRKVGSGAYADMTIFSFHPVKPITTGEGGAVLTNDSDLAYRLRLMRNHGVERDPAKFVSEEGLEDGERRWWFYEQQHLGFNYRITDLQAALGLSQLGKLDAFCNRRREIALRYDEAFSGLPNIKTHQSSPEQRRRSGHHLYLVGVDLSALGVTRHTFMRSLHAQGVGTQVHYIPIYRQPYYRDRYGFDVGDYPACEAYYAGCLSLPLQVGMSDEEVEYVAQTVRRAVEA